MTEEYQGSNSVKQATETHATSLAALHFLSHTKSFKPYASRDWVLSRKLEAYERDWNQRCRNPQLKTLIIEKGDRIAGMVSIRPGDEFRAEKDPQKISYLEGMHVHPDFMRIGLGRILIQKAKKLALSEDYGVVYLHVMEANTPASRLFTSEGFLPEKRLPTGEEGVPIILCRWDLSLEK